MKRLYFKHPTAPAVASITGKPDMLSLFAPVLEAGGFEQCTNEQWLAARWGTWNEGVLDIEADEVTRKKVKNGDQ